MKYDEGLRENNVIGGLMKSNDLQIGRNLIHLPLWARPPGEQKAQATRRSPVQPALVGVIQSHGTFIHLKPPENKPRFDDVFNTQGFGSCISSARARREDVFHVIVSDQDRWAQS